jgi:hypothetical protein
MVMADNGSDGVLASDEEYWRPVRVGEERQRDILEIEGSKTGVPRLGSTRQFMADWCRSKDEASCELGPGVLHRTSTCRYWLPAVLSARIVTPPLPLFRNAKDEL